jgi:hypothetical protein
MTDEVFADTRSGFAGRMRDLADGAKDMFRAALREAMAWDFYKWTVLALLTAIFLLTALSYGGIRAELAALKENQGGVSAQSLADHHADMQKQIADLKASLTQSMADMKSGLDASLAKISAKVDARSAAPRPAPAQKPSARPRQ